jgi:hypothetical protein
MINKFNIELGYFGAAGGSTKAPSDQQSSSSQAALKKKEGIQRVRISKEVAIADIVFAGGF